MGKLKSKMTKFINEKGKGSKPNAAKEAQKWYSKALRSFRDNSVAKAKILPFMPGKIYVFRYDNPKTLDYLAWWDRNPVVLALDPVGNNDCGINLNLLPLEIKEQLLDDVYTKLSSMIESEIKGNEKNANYQGQLDITYEGAKKYLDKYGFGFAVRQYVPELKRKQAVVSYENWHLIALCDFIELEGASLASIQRQFRDYNKK
jgi:hypothetical protein